ncbi:MAG: GTPase Era, partial [Clostridia bacterium]|nr:GTPase Era [Clostridia bacterium]
NLKTVLVINKIDMLAEKSDLLSVITAYTNKYNFAAVVPLSAKTGDGVEFLLEELLKFTKPSAHFFEDGVLSDQPDSVMVSEIIREKALYRLDKEIPHGIAVGIDRFFERDDANGEPIIEIYATIYTERDSHKGIIIGKNGTMLKKIGIDSRFELEKFFGTKVLLQLWVKVKKDWRNSVSLIHNFGLD